MDSVTIRDVRNKGAEVFARVARGETLIVTRDGEPVAQIIPVPRTRYTTAQLQERWKHLPDLDSAQWIRDVDEIFDQTIRDPWEGR